MMENNFKCGWARVRNVRGVVGGGVRASVE